jgi:hypothetical protein
VSLFCVAACGVIVGAPIWVALEYVPVAYGASDCV